MNETDSREARSIAAKRGRQPRRGSTAQGVSEVQGYWGDNKSGKKDGKDEGPDDEDEVPDQTPPGN